MSLGIHEAVEVILSGGLAGIEGVLGFPLAPRDKDVASELPTGSDGELQAYYYFHVTSARPTSFALRKGGTIIERGMVQVSVYVPDARGPAASRLAGDLVRNLFPRLTTLGLAETDDPAWASALLQESPYNHVPVTVPWVARLREGDR